MYKHHSKFILTKNSDSQQTRYNLHQVKHLTI